MDHQRLGDGQRRRAILPDQRFGFLQIPN
jgi:hypothetical protein